MENDFSTRLRAAGGAGWRILLIGIGIVTAQWIAYLVIIARQPGWFLALWGDGTTWSEVRIVWLVAMAALKLILAVMALILAWAALWSARLRGSTNASA